MLERTTMDRPGFRLVRTHALPPALVWLRVASERFRRDRASGPSIAAEASWAAASTAHMFLVDHFELEVHAGPLQPEPFRSRAASLRDDPISAAARAWTGTSRDLLGCGDAATLVDLYRRLDGFQRMADPTGRGPEVPAALRSAHGRHSVRCVGELDLDGALPGALEALRDQFVRVVLQALASQIHEFSPPVERNGPPALQPCVALLVLKDISAVLMDATGQAAAVPLSRLPGHLRARTSAFCRHMLPLWLRALRAQLVQITDAGGQHHDVLMTGAGDQMAIALTRRTVYQLDMMPSVAIGAIGIIKGADEVMRPCEPLTRRDELKGGSSGLPRPL